MACNGESNRKMLRWYSNMHLHGWTQYLVNSFEVRFVSEDMRTLLHWQEVVGASGRRFLVQTK